MYASVAARGITQKPPPAPGNTGNVSGIRPMTPRGRKPSTFMYGNAKNENSDEEDILGADVDLCLVGVSKDATKDQLENFIKGKGINVIETECLSNKELH